LAQRWWAKISTVSSVIVAWSLAFAGAVFFANGEQADNATITATVASCLGYFFSISLHFHDIDDNNYTDHDNYYMVRSTSFSGIKKLA
jgi:hypothetical protein